MLNCRSCAREIPLGSRLCPFCGTPVAVASADPTITSPRPNEDSHSSSTPIDDARFTPGTVLADRYRIVGLLGKGGMGEVYRADDLKLRQSVALKFLPEAFARDRRRLERLRHEVRIAREVSHPNVCRVYDISEDAGRPFLTMEYVDGEDLASLLRRMGRPSQEKAIQIARQLCAGLAAAHDKGVLHRDLKPHNVMIDGKGRVRITDFGLAGFSGQFAGADLGVGTPAYMAPEQFEGRVSVKSDLYSLGLVLFELFTGKRAFEFSTAELLRSRSGLSAANLFSLVPEIDPAIDRIVLRCLEREPNERPSSALAVAAALPGGDPLAEALAAGETPSPELVAAAGEVGGLQSGVGAACLLGLVAGIGFLAALNNPTQLVGMVPLPKTANALADRAEDILKELGHTTPIVDRAFGFKVDTHYLDHIEKTDSSPRRWETLRKPRPSAIQFWYRSSAHPLITPTYDGRAIPSQPPLDDAGMAKMLLEPSGALLELAIVHPQIDVPDSAGQTGRQTDWSALFRAAHLDQANFLPADPQWTPLLYCEERAAWEGPLPGEEPVPLRVEACASGGKPVFLHIIGPWRKARRDVPISPSEVPRANQIIVFSFTALVFGGAGVIALHNLRRRRGDRAGALRLSAVVFIAGMLYRLLTIDHAREPVPEIRVLSVVTGKELLSAAWLYVLYIALEPYVRRRWPRALISWTRLLGGRLRDPLVGRDILVGLLVGVVLCLIDALRPLLIQWLGFPPPRPSQGVPDTLLGGRYIVATLLNLHYIWLGPLILFVLFILRVLFRRQWLAAFAFIALLTIPRYFAPPSGLTGIGLLLFTVTWAILPIVLIVVSLRFGLLALCAAAFAQFFLADEFTITLDVSTWYVGASFTAMGVVIAVAGYAFHTALAGRPLFTDELLGS